MAGARCACVCARTLARADEFAHYTYWLAVNDICHVMRSAHNNVVLVLIACTHTHTLMHTHTTRDQMDPRLTGPAESPKMWKTHAPPPRSPGAPGATRGAGRASRAIWIRRGDPLQHPTEGGTPNVSIRLPILAANAQTDRSEVRHTSRMEWMRHTSLRGPSSRAAGISLAPGLKLPSRFPVDRIDLGHLTSDIGDRHLADRGAVRSLLLA